MRWCRLLGLAVVVAGCARDSGPVILLSIDGFRYDYLERGLTPNLSALASGGATAPLVPSFPTKTFPNHYTMVTGLYPGEHGIVSNNTWDPEWREMFTLGNREAVGDARWWGGEPVWVTAERAGQPTHVMFWPGSEAAIGGVRPTRWMAYDHELSHDARVDSLVAWLSLPADSRPAFLAWYMPAVDDAGHRHGPDAPETDSAIVRVDRAVGRLLTRLDSVGMRDRVRLVIVSDHGMSALSPDRVVALADYVPDTTGLRLVDVSPFFQLWGDSARLAAVMPRLRQVPHLTVWWRDSIPGRFRYRGSPRVAPIVGLVDDGWTLLPVRPRPTMGPVTGGNHGFADTLASMRALFIAHGPGVRRDVVGEPFGNVHVYLLLMRLLDLPPAPNSASPDSIAGFLR